MIRAALRQKAAVAMLCGVSAAVLVPACGRAQSGPTSRQGDPKQSPSVFELSQPGREDASRQAPPLPRLGGAAPRVSTKPLVKLKSVKVEGAHALDEATIAEAYRPYLGRKVSQADLVQLAADISERYRAAGYHLSRAIIPPQDVAGGRLKIRIIEGSITDIVVQGERVERFGIPAMLAPIAAEQPSRRSTFERQLLLVNDIPGVRIADTTLEEIGKASGRFRLVVMAQTWNIYVAAGLDNLGSAAVGPVQAYTTATLNSYFAAGDALTVNFSAVPENPQELLYGFASYDVPVGTSGFRLGATAWHSAVWPGDERRDFDTRTDSTGAEVRASIAPIQTLTSTLRLTLALGLGEFSESDVFGSVYKDHVRTVSVAADYSFEDFFGGRNYVGVLFRQGLDVFGASSVDDPFMSRDGASPNFSVVDLAFSRLQRFSDVWSARVAAGAQFASEPLFTSQQFYLGGAKYGRGFDGGLISGDNGVGATAELMFDQKAPPYLSPYLLGYQLYGFVDGGAVWDNGLDSVFGTRSVLSVGFGTRLFLPDDWQAGVALAFPVMAQNFDHDGYAPRVLFSVSKSFRFCPGRGQVWCN